MAGLLSSQSTVAPQARGGELQGVLEWLERLPVYRLEFSSLHAAAQRLNRLMEAIE